MAQIEIHLSPREDGSVAVSAKLPGSHAEHIVPSVGVQAVRRNVAELMASFETGLRPLADPVLLAVIGLQLRDVFLRPINGAMTDDTPLRLLFTSDDPECLNLPWELLPGADGQFLVADARRAIRRSTRVSLPPPSLPLAALPLRILFTACAPIDQSGLDYEKEEETILRIADKLGSRVHLEIAETGTFEELRELILEHRPHIVHLSGHGSVRDGIGSFAFENDCGLLDTHDARKIAAQLFAGSGVRLVFINGCQTAQAAVAGVCQALTAGGHVPLALGWGASIADDHATEFARVFFHDLAAGQPVDHSVASARAALLARCRIRAGGVDLLDASFALPQLHAADGTDVLVDDRLPLDLPKRSGVRYELLGDNIRGLIEGFVGRRRQLQRTRPALRSGEKKVVLLTGIGGAGKSTLATRLANRCVQEGYRVVALQARRDDAAQFCLRLVTELATACQRLGREADETTLLDGKRPLENRLRLAVEILNETKILLVLDNLESLMPLPPAAHDWEWDEVAAFFTHLTTRLTGEGRAILTCRYLPVSFDPLPPNLSHEAMPDFTYADFFKYLRRHPRVAERMERGELDRDLIETFHSKLGATPRFVEQACSILGTLDADRLAQQLDNLGEPAAGTAGDDLWQLQQSYFRDLFLPQLYNTLPAPFRLALSRLALVREALPLDGLVRVTGLEETVTQDFAHRSLGLSLLQRFGEKDETELFAVYPLQREFFTALERLPDEPRHEAHLAAVAFFRECYEQERENEVRLDSVAEILACLHHATEGGNLQEKIWAITKLGWVLIGRFEYANALALVNPILSESRHSDLLAIAACCASATGDWLTARKLIEEEQRQRQIIGDRAGEAVAWHNLATIDTNEGNYAVARKKFGQSLVAFEATGDRAGEAATLAQLGMIDMKEGHYLAAREKLDKSLTMRQVVGDRAGEAETLADLGMIDLHESKHSAARVKFDQSLAIKQAIDDREGETETLHNLASIDLIEGNYTAAREKFGKSLATLQAIGDRADEAATWHQLAMIDLKEGNFSAARKEFGESLAINQAIGHRSGEASTWHNLASVDLYEENYAAAREKLGQSLAIRQAIGDQEGTAAAWHSLASIDFSEGNNAAAREKFSKSLAMRQTLGDRAGEAATFAQIGLVASSNGRLPVAVRCTAIAFQIFNVIGAVEKKRAWKNLTGMAADLRLDETGFGNLLREAAEHYQCDRGTELVRQAFEGL